MEGSRAKANRVLPRERTGHNKHPLPTTEKMTLHIDNTRLSILKSDQLYSLLPKLEKLYLVSKNKTRGSDCGSDHEFLIAKFRLKLKKVGKTTRPFRYQFSSVTQLCPTLRPHGLQHARLPCPSPTPGAYSNSCPSSWWCHPTISPSVAPFSSHL